MSLKWQSAANEGDYTEPRRRATRRNLWWRFAQTRRAVLGLIWLLLIAIVVLFAPWISPYSLSYANLLSANQPPSLLHLFGTSSVGQDMLTMNLYGIRYTVTIAFGATVVAFVIGSAIGLTAGMAKGLVDHVLMRLTDFMFAFPGFFFSVVLVAVFGRTIPELIVFIGIVQWAGFARLIRGLVLSIRDSDLVESATVLGASPFYVATRYVFPNVVNQVIVYSAFAFANMMSQEAMMSLMGYGPRPPFMSLGTLMSEAIPNVLGFTYLLYCPLGVFVLTLVSLVLVGEGLQSALNPKGGGMR